MRMAAKDRLTHDRLRELIHYDPDTGIFRRKVRKSDLRKDETVTPERLREVLEYDQATGVFVWKKKTAKKIVVGTVAGIIKPTGSGLYRYIAVDGVRYLAHRLAWLYVHAAWPSLLRFRDGDTQNCAIENLEDAGATLATNKTGQGYLYIRVDGMDFPAAQLAWFWIHGRWPTILRFRDNDRENLRLANLRDPSIEPAYSRTDQGRCEARKARYEGQRDRSRDLAFQAKYGIDFHEYQRIAKQQGNVCAICGRPETAKRNGKPRWLAVDHCHDTGKVRGLLCGSCNPMIGYADHSIDILTRAIHYLRRTKEARARNRSDAQWRLL
jgi:hypothetical protein